MRTINPPRLNAANWLDSIVQAKHNPRRQRLIGITPRLAIRYAEYMRHVGDLAALTEETWTEEQHGDCCNCYDAPTIASKRLESRLKRSAQDQTGGFCPYCGINAHHTIDHYAPRQNFPEFSVFPPNLVPSCGDCNPQKGTVWLNDADERVIISPYYDFIPCDTQFLFARVRVTEENVPEFKFRVTPPATLPAPLRRRIRSHFKKLRLQQRFKGVVSPVASEVRRSLLSAGVTSGDTARECLQRMYIQKRDAYGLNHWQTVAVQGLEQSNQYIDGVINEVRTASVNN